ncbi:hypothetical protein HYZ99_02915 [Candidatus Peregrinibacteria bacterium]|nr:hypothetical protein [Candidatus Peregrinibacteria bacterium]
MMDVPQDPPTLETSPPTLEDVAQRIVDFGFEGPPQGASHIVVRELTIKRDTFHRRVLSLLNAMDMRLLSYSAEQMHEIAVDIWSETIGMSPDQGAEHYLSELRRRLQNFVQAEAEVVAENIKA